MVLALAPAGCSRDPAFLCSEDADCNQSGQCEMDGNCSFLDEDCPSGRRYGKLGDALHASMCVPVRDETTSTSGKSTQPPSPSDAADTSSTGLQLTATGSTGSSTGSSTTALATGSTDASSTDADSSSGGEMMFVDDFERADSATLGNGWWEQSTAFELIAGEVHNLGIPVSFEDHLALRPQDVVPVDSEQTVEFTVTVKDFTSGSPQLHARVQDIVDVPSSRSYICFANEDEVCTARHLGGSFSNSLCESTPVPFTLGQRYRLTMNTSGQDTVSVDCLLDIFDDNEGWVAHAQQSFFDNSDERITEGGQVGFSAHRNPGAFVYDNYTLTAL